MHVATRDAGPWSRRTRRCCRSVVMPTIAMHVPVRHFFGGGIAHFNDFDVEGKILAGHRVVEIDIDNAHADLQHRHRARALDRKSVV